MLFRHENKLAVYGFIKRLKLASDIPDVIKNLIIEFTKFYFCWQDSKHGEGFEFNDEDPTRIKQSKSGWTFLAMDDILSLDVYKKFTWQLKIEKQLDHTYCAWMFGVVEYPREESVKHWKYKHFAEDPTTKSRQFGIYVSSSYRNFRKYGDNTCIMKDGKNVTDRWKDGDKFTLIVDFEKKDIVLMFNDENMAVYKNIQIRCSCTLCIGLMCMICLIDSKYFLEKYSYFVNIVFVFNWLSKGARVSLSCSTILSWGM